jgi:hypothetical protein
VAKRSTLVFLSTSLPSQIGFSNVLHVVFLYPQQIPMMLARIGTIP